MSTTSGNTPPEAEPRLAARADLCRLLAACFYEPGPEFAEEHVFDAMAEAAAQLDARLGHLALRVGAAFDAAEPAALLVDYARLFMGPPLPRARPYAASWLDDPDTMARVARFYAEGGFDLSEDFRDRPDHVAAELEFLYLLLFEAARAQMEGRDEGATAELRRRFTAHVRSWIDPFGAAVSAAAESPFYRELAALTRGFVALE